MNLLVIGGRLGRAAESATTATGKQVVKFPVAVDTGYGESKKTMWINCQKWGNTSSALLKCLAKGTYVLLTGRLDSYKDKDNEKITRYQMMVDSVELGGSRKDSAADSTDESGSAAPEGKNTVAAVDDDYVPF